MNVMVIARGVGGGPSSSGRVDVRGNFAIEPLTPGQYELEARPVGPQNPQQGLLGTPVKQTVSLADGETAKVTLTFGLKAP